MMNPNEQRVLAIVIPVVTLFGLAGILAAVAIAVNKGEKPQIPDNAHQAQMQQLAQRQLNRHKSSETPKATGTSSTPTANLRVSSAQPPRVLPPVMMSPADSSSSARATVSGESPNVKTFKRLAKNSEINENLKKEMNALCNEAENFSNGIGDDTVKGQELQRRYKDIQLRHDAIKTQKSSIESNQELKDIFERLQLAISMAEKSYKEKSNPASAPSSVPAPSSSASDAGTPPAVSTIPLPPAIPTTPVVTPTKKPTVESQEQKNERGKSRLVNAIELNLGRLKDITKSLKSGSCDSADANAKKKPILENVAKSLQELDKLDSKKKKQLEEDFGRTEHALELEIKLKEKAEKAASTARASTTTSSTTPSSTTPSSTTPATPAKPASPSAIPYYSAEAMANFKSDLTLKEPEEALNGHTVAMNALENVRQAILRLLNESVTVDLNDARKLMMDSGADVNELNVVRLIAGDLNSVENKFKPSYIKELYDFIFKMYETLVEAYNWRLAFDAAKKST